MKNRVLGFKIIIFLAIVFFAGAIFEFSFPVYAQNTYDYIQLESIPGFEDSGSDLKSYIESVYKFGIWTVGIAAVLMITIGGFMYLTSAGNTSKMDVAKKVVTDAIIGLVVALGAYLILYVINPDLIKINISMEQLGTSSGTGGAGVGTTSPTTSGAGTGKCQPVTSGACSVDKMTGVCNWDPEKASAICYKESSGKENPTMSADNCVGGGMFSVGRFQVNLTCQTENANCVKAFNLPKPTGKCINSACKIIDQTAYASCKSYFVQNNIQAACKLYNTKNGWNHWSVNKGSSGCGFTK